MGKLKVNVKYGIDAQTMELYVLRNVGVPLFGREWLRNVQLNWQEIKAMQITPKQNNNATDEKLILTDTDTGCTGFPGRNWHPETHESTGGT